MKSWYRAGVARRSILLVIAALACGGNRTAPETPAATVAPLPPPPPPASASTSTTTTPPPEPTADTQPVESQSTMIVDRDTWVNAFETALPVALCKSGSYFTSCFSVTQVECEQMAASATRVCLGKVRKQLPAKFHQPDEGRAWGSKIGSCAGTAYETAIPNKKIHNPKCDDPNAWSGP